MEDPKIVEYPITEAMRGYLYRLVELGAVEGPVGAMNVTPELAAVIAAAHEVLAGGDVEIVVRRPGNADIKADLGGRLAVANRHANEINNGGGVYVTAV